MKVTDIQVQTAIDNAVRLLTHASDNGHLDVVDDKGNKQRPPLQMMQIENLAAHLLLLQESLKDRAIGDNLVPENPTKEAKKNDNRKAKSKQTKSVSSSRKRT